MALAAIALSPLAPALAARLPACPIKGWTGWPCPSCGTTRATLALADLDLAAALAANPLAALGWILLVGGGLAAALISFAPRPLAEPRTLAPALRWALAAAFAANWAYLAWAGR